MQFAHRLVIGFGLSFAFTTAYGWVDSGHMVIAAIAYDHLTPAARKAADELLKIGGTPETSDFVTAACWADDIRRERRETGHWHYIDLHFRSDGQADANQPDAENVVWAISKFKHILADKGESQENRAEALRFLIHFVGDIHQPLHSVARDTDALPSGDAGGNKFKIVPPTSLGDPYPPRNLHALWDLGCGLFPATHRNFRPLDEDGKAEIESIAKKLEHTTPDSRRILAASDPMAWAKEGEGLAKSIVYALPEGTEPSAQYLAKGQSISGERAAEAGYRLAAMLNEVLK